MFPVKHTVIYTFFAITSVQNTCFCCVFNPLASKNPAKSCYVQCFFHFWPFFHCRKATKMTQNSISYPLALRHPKSSINVDNTTVFWSRCETVCGPPPPAKADIATAILTNVIEHLVLLLPPNKHAFTAKAVWADSCCTSAMIAMWFLSIHCMCWLYQHKVAKQTISQRDGTMQKKQPTHKHVVEKNMRCSRRFGGYKNVMLRKHVDTQPIGWIVAPRATCLQFGMSCFVATHINKNCNRNACRRWTLWIMWMQIKRQGRWRQMRCRVFSCVFSFNWHFCTCFMIFPSACARWPP